MLTPEDLKYSPHHLWIKLEENHIATIGISDYAQELLGDIVYVEAPAVGSTLQAGTVCGIAESVKTASDLFAPLSGVVKEVNSELSNSPDLVNETPYAAWIFRIHVANIAETSQLMSADSYRQFVANT